MQKVKAFGPLSHYYIHVDLQQIYTIKLSLKGRKLCKLNWNWQSNKMSCFFFELFFLSKSITDTTGNAGAVFEHAQFSV